MKQTLTMAWLTLALSAMAKDVYVDDDNYNDEYVDDSAAYIAAGYDGTTPEKAFGTIQAAIDASTTAADDTVLVCPGTYDKGGRMFNYSSSDAGYTRVIATKKLTIKSTEGAAKTHIVMLFSSVLTASTSPIAEDSLSATVTHTADRTISDPAISNSNFL